MALAKFGLVPSLRNSSVEFCRPRAAEVAEESKAGDSSVEAVLQALEAADIPWSGSRKNVLPDGQDAVQGMILGMYVFAAKIGVSSATERHPWLARLLVAFANAHNPDFMFTSIQVNKNYAARPHVDKNNLGTSMIIGLGSYDGGELWVHDENDAGDVSFELQEDISCMYHYRSGASYRGRDVDIRDKWLPFNGNRLHFTRPFTGDRYSLVYFTCWASLELQESLREKLEEKRRCRELLEAERREKLRSEKEALGHCFARTWSRGWGGDCANFRLPGGGDFCNGHKDAWKTHGRTDGPVPPKKLEEMRKWQEILLKTGKLPSLPLPLGAVILVELPAQAE
ncbi:unnamed protein product [Polarella glacialis]|uniref:Uncharacterized protein n=1 Tax=Polarella glacialis TaxID=89957 RepID=A0A813JXU5_POLGL|nr:unnamed protein product [Polarella glacialis]